MSIQIYKPNKSNNGFAFNFSIGINKKNKEPVLYVSAIAQHSWDEKKRLGSFTENKDDPEKNINLKFNEFECGGIINAIERRYEYSTFHQFDNNLMKFVLPFDAPPGVQISVRGVYIPEISQAIVGRQFGPPE